MRDGDVAMLVVVAWFAFLALLAGAMVFFGVRWLVNSSKRRDATLAHGYATGHLSATAGSEQVTWYARFVPDLGVANALVPFSGVRQLGLVRLANGHLEFWPKGADRAAWVAPVAEIRVRVVDFAIGRSAGYPIRLASPQSGRLMGELSLEPLNTFGELQLKDQRNRSYSRHFVDLLVAAGATRG